MGYLQGSFLTVCSPNAARVLACEGLCENPMSKLRGCSGLRPGLSSAIPVRQAPTASRGRQGRLCGTGVGNEVLTRALVGN